MKVRKTRKNRGFSLLELLAVVTILGIIAAVVIPRISVSANSAKVAANAQNIAEINSAVERWYFNKGTYPASDLSDIAADKSYLPDGIPANPLSTHTTYELDADNRAVAK